MEAPSRFCNWMSQHIANDNKYGRKLFRYHPRSDEHSKKICGLILEDLLNECSALQKHAKDGLVVGGINSAMTFINGKTKALDLAIGVPASEPRPCSQVLTVGPGKIKDLRISFEAKQCMTEHSKTKPRLFDELSSSHEIVHQGQQNAIAAGVVVVNISTQYASPTRQISGEGDLIITTHKQPHAALGIIDHIKGLKMRDRIDEVGFDALTVIVINCDNSGPCNLVTDPPAPQPGERHHYGTFMSRIVTAYEQRFAQP